MPDHRLGTEALQRRTEAFAAGVTPIIAELGRDGASLRQIAARLTERGIRTVRVGAWSADAVRQVLLRTKAAD